MKIILPIVLLLQTQTADTDYVKKVERVGESVLTILINTASFGFDAWNKLSASQGKRILEDVETKTATLISANDTLKTDMENSIKEGKASAFPIKDRIKVLNNQITEISKKIAEFDAEIDKTSPHAAEGREKMTTHGDAKPRALNGVEQLWTQGRYQAAINRLREGIDELEKLKNADRCLLDSIDKKKAVCDSDLKRLPN